MNAKAVIVTILVLAIVAGGGYYVWHKHKINQQTTGSNQNQTSLQSSQTSSLPATENSSAATGTNTVASGTNAIIEQSGLKIETLRQGTGEAVKSGDRVLVNYVGTLTDGTKFDSSYDRGVPLQFVVGAGQVIQGWEQGLLGMKVEEKRRLTIPPEMAYGTGGIAGVIPPNATLIFEIELLQIIH